MPWAIWFTAVCQRHDMQLREMRQATDGPIYSYWRGTLQVLRLSHRTPSVLDRRFGWLERVSLDPPV